MYMKRMLEIGVAENGFVVECRVPIKKKSKKESKEICCDYPGSTEKQYIAKDAAEVTALVEKLMPLLDDEFSSEDEYDQAFDKATK